MDISNPDVENSHTPATTETIRSPTGKTVDTCSRAGHETLDGPPAGHEPAGRADQPEDNREPLECHEGQRPRGGPARVNSHRGSESTSTRSPTLKTSPCPASRLSMIRKLMKASSSTHRYCQAPTRTMTRGTRIGHHRTTDGEPGATARDWPDLTGCTAPAADKSVCAGADESVAAGDVAPDPATPRANRMGIYPRRNPLGERPDVGFKSEEVVAVECDVGRCTSMRLRPRTLPPAEDAPGTLDRRPVSAIRASPDIKMTGTTDHRRFDLERELETDHQVEVGKRHP